MTTSSRTETINGPDGSFDAHVVVPESGSGPGLVIIQEIFGVNTYIKAVCERVAQMGYVAIAPDMFGGWSLASPWNRIKAKRA